MPIVLYTSPFSSATPVEHALLELDVPHERIVFDLNAKDQQAPAFLALNPNGKVPTLVVDGTPIFEALAIMQWLGETYGVARGLWPAADAPERLEAMSWTAWAYVSFVGVLRQFNYAGHEQFPSALHHEAQRAYSLEELRGLLRILDERLSNADALVGERFSLVDLVVGNAVVYGAFAGMPVEGFAHLQRWMSALQARPAFRRVWQPSEG